jgi:Matrixin
MLRRLLPFLLLACALLAPATARADSVMRVPADAHRAHLAQAAAAPRADPATDPQIAQWMAIAQAHWGTAPNCPDGISIQRAEWLPDPGVWAAAVQGGCAVAFDPDFYPAPADYDQAWYQAAMCSVVAHEWGHLLGHGHVADPNSLMNPVTPINIVGGCPTWGLSSAASEPSETTPVHSSTAPAKKTTRKSAKKKTSTCAGKAKAKSRSSKRAKTSKRCAAPRKRGKSKTRR